MSSVDLVDLLLSCTILVHPSRTCSCSIWLRSYLSLLSLSSGRQLALVFQTKPSRKLYPDYYQIIKNPIALDDIKKRLDTGAYSSLQTIRTDFELLFNNALEYNMKDSVIWKDAKDMHVSALPHFPTVAMFHLESFRNSCRGLMTN